MALSRQPLKVNDASRRHDEAAMPTPAGEMIEE
jgi:hypothetical protein